MSSIPAYAFRPRTHFGKWHREAKLKQSTLVSLRSENRYQGSGLLKILKFSGQDKGKEKNAQRVTSKVMRVHSLLENLKVNGHTSYLCIIQETE